MARIDNIDVEVSIVVGEVDMSLGKFLSLGRGAVFSLNRKAHQPLSIMANGQRFAEGAVRLDGERVNVKLTRRAP